MWTRRKRKRMVKKEWRELKDLGQKERATVQPRRRWITKEYRRRRRKKVVKVYSRREERKKKRKMENTD